MSPWRTLGLERTDDATAVRRAYAARLKKIDVDAEPDAFIALRAALDQALGQIAMRRWEEQAEAAPVLADDEVLVDAAAAPLDWRPEPAPLPDAEGELVHDDGARFVALEQLLFAGDDAPPPDPEALALALQPILDHPRMAQVDHNASVEIWLAELLFDSVPRSDPVLSTIIDHFGWEAHAGRIDQPWVFDELVMRREAFRMLDRLADPRHLLHEAYLDLISDKESLGLRPFGRAGAVGDLLTTIRRDAPAAEAYLSPHRVALWDERLNRGVAGGLKLTMLIFWGLFILVKIFTASSPTSSSGPPPVSVSGPPVLRSYENPDIYLTPLIRQASGERLDAAALAAGNPPLYRRLIARWEQARDRNEQTFMLDNDIATLLDQAATEGVRGGSYEVRAAYWRVRMDELRWRRSTGAEDCLRAPGTGTPPSDLLRRRDEARALALAAPPPDPRPPMGFNERRRFTIPGPVVERIASRTELGEAALSAALLGGGEPAHRCAVRIALIEAALALPPREGAPLLRDLSIPL